MENGSGKSAIITAVKIFQDLIINDNYLNESKTQTFLEEIINKSTHRFCFNCEFLVDMNFFMEKSMEPSIIVYSYSIELGKNDNGLYEIQSEILKVKNGNYNNDKYTRVFECHKDELVYVNASDSQKQVLEKNHLIFWYLILLYICINNMKIDNDSSPKITRGIIRAWRNCKHFFQCK